MLSRFLFVRLGGRALILSMRFAKVLWRSPYYGRIDFILRLCLVYHSTQLAVDVPCQQKLGTSGRP